MKIGILGGTFDPVHNGHLHIAGRVKTALGLSQIWFLPAGQSPFKQEVRTVPFAERLHMVKLAIQEIPGFLVNPLEGLRNGVSYTVDTLEMLCRLHPQDQFWFIMGADAWDRFPQWKKAERILQLSELVVVSRPGWRLGEPADGAISPERWQRVHQLTIPGVELSSTDVRRRIRQKESVEQLLPPAVRQYIEANNLYAINEERRTKPLPMTEQKIQELTDTLQQRLKPKRFRHSLGVAETARKLAVCHGADPEKAYIAGLLHDYAKNLKKAEQLDIAEKEGLLLHPVEKELPEVLHGPVGAFLLPKETGLDDPEILQAIARHTLGAFDMTLLDKIIFVADAVEPNRDTPNLKEEQKIAFADLDRAVLRALESTIRYCLDIGRLLHPHSVALRNEYVRRLKEKEKE